MKKAPNDSKLEPMILQGHAHGPNEKQLTKEAARILTSYLQQAKHHGMQHVSHSITLIEKGKLLVTVAGYVRKTLSSDIQDRD
jgi:hypothetical protein